MEILILDEHPRFREGLRFVLSDLQNGLSFKEALCLSDVSVDDLHTADLAFMNLSALDSKGIESLIRLRSLSPASSIVILSSDNDPFLVHDCIEGGAAGFIPKNSRPTVLIDALSLVLAGGIYLPQQSFADSMEMENKGAESEAVVTLTAQQRTALLLTVRGFTNRIIGLKMAITEGCVKLHVHAAFNALGVKSRAEAVFLISRIGLTDQASRCFKTTLAVG